MRNRTPGVRFRTHRGVVIAEIRCQRGLLRIGIAIELKVRLKIPGFL